MVKSEIYGYKNGSLYYCEVSESGLAVDIKNASIDVDVNVSDYISVTQSGAYINAADNKYNPQSASRSYFEGFECAVSGIAPSGTAFSGIYIPSRDVYLRGVTIQGTGLGDYDQAMITASGVYLVSGAYLYSNTTATYKMEIPFPVASGCLIEAKIINKTAKDSSVTGIFELLI